MGKKIIYLDQSYLSNMAKAQAGVIENAADSNFYRRLFDVLHELVVAEKVICPESEFHGIEAAFESRISDEIYKTIDDLSGGLHLLHFDAVIFNQVASALAEYLQVPKKQAKWWKAAFHSDPDAPLGPFRVSVRVPWPQNLIEHDRKLKAAFPHGALPLIKNAPQRTFDEELLAQKKSFVLSYFEAPLLAPTPADPISQLVRVVNYWRVLSRLEALKGMGLPEDKIADFLHSDQLRSIPFIDILCSIEAVIVQHYISRRIRPSDLHDVPVLAVALPFCDVVTTDRFMKEIVVNRLSFHEKYRVTVYSPTRKDRRLFREFLEAIRDSKESS